MDIYRSILQQYWGYDDFRGIQRPIIESIGSGKDTLGLMPTGGGKSITFQVPALTMHGICIVITPLIALMKDQVQALNKRGIKAAYIHSGLSHEMILTVLENCVFGAYRFLYISPERIGSEIFVTKLQHMEVSFITIDEAHCICQWGYDFRPSYLQIAAIRKLKPDCPVLALTATATPEVARDIQKRLEFREENVFRMSFHRPNLAYTVYRADAKFQGMLYVLDTIPGSCIIYSRNRQNCKDLAENLQKMGYTATYYHAGLKTDVKDARQDAWLNNEYRIMVATNAFGMGIDKPDVRLVIHVDLPDSIEEYFQEAGRAGRDGELSYSVIVMDGREVETSRRRVAQRFPKVDYIRDLYEDLCFFLRIAINDGMNVTREFNQEEFCRTFHYHPVMMRNALEILDKAGYISYRDEEDNSSRLRIDATRNQLLRAVDSQDERIMMSLFRNYGGIFVDYIFLDEYLISKETGLSVDVIYQDLTELSRRGLLSYIPRKHVPRITFLRRRVEKSDLHFSYEVYDQRKEAFEYRIRAMREYCMNDEECRSRLLLKYFGEKGTKDCGICDVCRSWQDEDLSDEDFQAIRQHLLKQLDNGPVHVSQIDVKGIDRDKLRIVVSMLCASEEIVTDNMYLQRKNIKP